MESLRNPLRPATGGIPTATAVVVVLFALQDLRLLVVTGVGVLRDRLGWSTPWLALFLVAIVTLGIVVARSGSRLGPVRCATASAAGVVLLRVGAQLWVGDPLGETVLAAAGTALVVPALAASSGSLARPLLLGMAADVALATGAWTWDLAWRSDLASLGAILAAALLGLVPLARRGVAPARAEVARDLDRSPAAAVPEGSAGSSVRRRLGPVAALGAAFYLHPTLIGSPAAVAARTDLSLVAAGALAFAGLAAGAALGPLVGRMGGREARFGIGAAAAVVALGGAAFPWEPPIASGALIAIQLAFAVLLGALPGASASASDRSVGSRPRALAAGLFVGLVLVFLHYASYDLPLGPLRSVLPAGCAIALAVAALARGRKADGAFRSGRDGGWETLGVLVAVAVALGVLVAPRPADPSARAPGEGGPRVVCWNLHGGVDPTGRLDPEAIVRVLSDEAPDVVALQEVSRGWAIFGGADLLELLERRLGFDCAFGPTAGRLWGNAICSRLPLLAVEQGDLPSEGLLLQRGWIAAQIDVHGGPVTVVSTHLHHPEDGGPVRERQVEALRERWPAPHRLVLAGDFNAPPGSPEIDALEAHGLRDAVDLSGLRAVGFTVPAPQPTMQIDYVWLSADLGVEAVVVRPEAASDHLAIGATIRLDGRRTEPTSGRR